VITRTPAWLGAALALLLAVRAAADPSAEEARKVKSAAAEGALDARPAPAGDPGPKGAPAPPAAAPPRPAEELPPAARASAWRAGARPPAEVPAEVVVRTAAKKKAAAAAAEKAKATPAADDCEVEITWHAPGT
jgi:hypothetical protein